MREIIRNQYVEQDAETIDPFIMFKGEGQKNGLIESLKKIPPDGWKYKEMVCPEVVYHTFIFNRHQNKGKARAFHDDPSR